MTRASVQNAGIYLILFDENDLRKSCPLQVRVLSLSGNPMPKRQGLADWLTWPDCSFKARV